MSALGMLSRAGRSDGTEPTNASSAPPVTPGQANKLRRVALVGFAPTTVMAAPFKDPDVEIWTLNAANMHPGITRISRLFQVHDPYVWREDANVYPGYVAWLRAQTFPIYLMEPAPDIPSAVVYPYRELAEEFGDYFTSTFSFMMFLAIKERYDIIELYGIDLAAKEEYRSQRAGGEYAIGIARGRGIKVVIPDVSPLIKHDGRYGHYTGDAGALRFTRQKMDERMADLHKQLGSAQAKVNAVQGAIQDCMFWTTLLQLKEATADVAAVEPADIVVKGET